MNNQNKKEGKIQINNYIFWQKMIVPTFRFMKWKHDDTIAQMKKAEEVIRK